MRQVWMTFSVVAMLLGTVSGVRAQTAHATDPTECGCQQSVPCTACANSGHACQLLSPTIKRGVIGAINALVPCCSGFDGRHKAYRAALRRNCFDHCGCLPFIPFGSASSCRHCQSEHPVYAEPMYEGEEVLEMHEMPGDAGIGPTPAAGMPADVPGGEPVDEVPSDVDVEKNARAWQWKSRSAARGTPLRSIAPHPARRTSPVQVVRARPSSRPAVTRDAEPLGQHVEQAVQASAPKMLTPPLHKKLIQLTMPVKQASMTQQRTLPDPVNPLRR